MYQAQRQGRVVLAGIFLAALFCGHLWLWVSIAGLVVWSLLADLGLPAYRRYRARRARAREPIPKARVLGRDSFWR